MFRLRFMIIQNVNFIQRFLKSRKFFLPIPWTPCTRKSIFLDNFEREWVFISETIITVEKKMHG